MNVAVVDGNLSKEYGGTRDGEKIVSEIKKQHPQIKVIGHASDDLIYNADVNSTKFQGSERLVETVTNI